ncbi:transcriptional repressor LexA [Advenella alkanexedens]|uniref:transcriptional repressor LexA n=1 Tax=Advenella alkanexedens TaxID=1481665 RepID=UPI0026769A78|nr:transcriptional repressor LexA [Advenella alkanexedens]WKU18303.1 transcriptional repressor LexA [Advenella alkanexedens]
MTIKLTARQQQVLDLIQQNILKTGFPPTRAEIAKTLGFKSPNAAEDHLKALAKKGAIILTAGASRGIRLATANPGPNINPEESFLDKVSQILLPVVGHVAAGNPILAAEHIDREINVDPALFMQQPDFLLKVKGQSMKDIGILDGDLLAVKKYPEARNGQVIVARIENEVTVKRFIKKTSHIELLPENPDFAPIIVRPNQEFTIEGIAVGLIRTHNLN